MQRTWLQTGALVAAVLLAGCGGSAATTTTTATTVTIDIPAEDEFEVFESEQLGFTIRYPVGWEVVPSTAEGIIGFTAPAATAGLSPNFNVTTGVVPDDVPANVYYQGERARLEANLPGAEIIEEANVNVDGILGRGITLVVNEGGRDVGISRMIVLKEGRAWEVSFFAEAAQLEQLTDLVARIFQSFRFLD